MARGSTLDEIPAVAYTPAEVQALVTASGQFLNIARESTEEPSKRLKRVGTAQAWQQDAEHWMECIGEVWYSHNYPGAVIARGQWLIGWVDDTGDLVPARGDDGMPVRGTDPVLVEAAQQALDRLAGPGGHADWSRPMGTFISSVGECYLLGYKVNDDGDPVPEEGDDGEPNPDAVDERWEAYSPTTVDKTKGDDQRWRYKVRRSAMFEPDTLPNDTLGVRVFRRGKFADDADGPMVALNDVCEDIELLNRAIRGSALSRTHAGLLLIPQEGLGQPMPAASLVVGAGSGTDGQGPPANPVITSIVAGLSTPARDPGSAAALVPTPITTKGEHIEKWRHLPLSRDIDPQLAEQRGELIRRYAQGTDLPPEILLGMADLNHWTAWQVGEDAWRHIEPTVIVMRDGLTSGYLWPSMRLALSDENDDGEDEGLDPRLREDIKRYRLMYDPTAVLTKPDRSEDADEAFDRGAISYAAYRRYKKFPESDAPTLEELQQRAALGFAAKPGTPAAVAVGTPASAVPSDGEARAEVVTAAAPPPLGDLTSHLAALDQDHLRRTVDLIEAAVTEAVAQAGAKMRSRAQRDPALRAMLTGRAASAVGLAIGPANARRLFATTDDPDGDANIEALFAVALAGMLAKYRAITEASIGDFGRALIRFTGSGFTEAEAALAAADITASEAVLSQGVTTVAKARLFDQAAHAITIGEAPAGVTVPTSVARRASARAGGAQVRGGPELLERYEGGIATGPERLDTLQARGLVKSGIVWDYGFGGRTNPFPPHQDLHGEPFTGPDDPGLDVTPWGLAFPGDHAGCMCTWSIRFVDEAGADDDITE